MIDGEEIAFRLRAAMDWRSPKIPGVDVAKRCGVSPQAVASRWRQQGQIDFKKHVNALAEATGVPPMFYLELRRGSTKETRAVWRRLAAQAASGRPTVIMTNDGSSQPKSARRARAQSEDLLALLAVAA